MAVVGCIDVLDMLSAHMPLLVLSKEQSVRGSALVFYNAVAFLVGPRENLSNSRMHGGVIWEECPKKEVSLDPQSHRLGGRGLELVIPVKTAKQMDCECFERVRVRCVFQTVQYIGATKLVLLFLVDAHSATDHHEGRIHGVVQGEPQVHVDDPGACV